MGRPSRIKIPELTYHITSRTNNRHLFFKKKKDQRTLCKILNSCLLKHNVTLYAFTPMMTHFHMLIKFSNETDLSRFMAEFKGNYAKYFNRRYQMSGHFWGDRYRSTIVQDDRHALACLRYIDRNPVKAGLVEHPSQWELNSFGSYAFGQIHPLLPLTPHPSYLGLAGSRLKRRNLYLAFVIGGDPLSDELYGRLHRMQIFGSEKFIALVKQAA